MYDFKIEAADKATLYADLLAALDGLTAGEPDAIANMANAAALLWETLPGINWAGFYRNVGGELVLGPFQGRPACIRIPFGAGVCGAAAETLDGAAGRGRPRLPRPHRLRRGKPSPSWWCRSCAMASCSRVLDLDSPEQARFDAEDEAGCVAICELLAERL